ncbi:MAG: ester cyclase [Actinomycetota bacterium]
MTPTELVERFHIELWGNGDMDAIARSVAPDATTVMTGFEGSTIEVMRDDVGRYVGAFSDVETEIVELFGDADRVLLWWTTTGTHVGPYGDIAPEPTGRRITMEGVDLYRVRGDMIVELRSFWDAATVYRQFGLLADGL